MKNIEDAFTSLEESESVSLQTNLAPIYDYVWNEEFMDYEQQTELVRTFVPEEVNSVLECACGTGRTIRNIESEFDDVTGIDIGEGLVSIAKERTNEANILKEDMTEYHRDEKVEFIYCLGFSLGALSQDELSAFISKSYDNLDRNGRLMVDVLDNQIPDGNFEETRVSHPSGYDIVVRSISVVDERIEDLSYSYKIESDSDEIAIGGEKYIWHQHSPKLIEQTLEDNNFDVKRIGSSGDNDFGERIVIIGDKK